MKFVIKGTVLFDLECRPKHFATGFVTVHVAINCEKVQLDMECRILLFEVECGTV